MLRLLCILGVTPVIMVGGAIFLCIVEGPVQANDYNEIVVDNVSLSVRMEQGD